MKSETQELTAEQIQETYAEVVAAMSNVDWPGVSGDVANRFHRMRCMSLKSLQSWPDDFDCGFKHAMNIASLHSGLPAALNAMETECAEHSGDPAKGECCYCGRELRDGLPVKPSEPLPTSVARQQTREEAEPTEEMWSGLARDIVMWRDMHSMPTGTALHRHLKRAGREIPAWLSTEIPDDLNVPSKGTVAVCIYKAMREVRSLDAATFIPDQEKL